VVPYLLVLPAVLLVGVVLVYPMLRAGWMSFLDWPFASPDQSEFVGLDNYRSLQGSTQFWTSLRFTGLFTIAAIVIEFILALGGALLLDGLRRGRGVMMSLAVAPYMVAPIAVGLIWRLMLQRDIGIVNYLTGLLGAPPVSWLSDAVPAFFATVTAESWMQMPFVMLILLAGLTAIPDDLMEAARMDGASPLKVITHLKLPLIAPYIAIALTFETIFKLRVFDLVLTLTRGGPGGDTTPLGLLIQRLFFRYFEGGTAAAASVVLLVIGGLVALVYMRLIYREIEY
jgi:multiple sugar transport system permease protein